MDVSGNLINKLKTDKRALRRGQQLHMAERNKIELHAIIIFT